MVVKENKLWAFWKYDGHYPRILGGEVVDIGPSGTVKTKQYGYMRFVPLLIVPKEEGQRIQTILKDLEGEYGRTERELKDKFEAERQYRLPPALLK